MTTGHAGVPHEVGTGDDGAGAALVGLRPATAGRRRPMVLGLLLVLVSALGVVQLVRSAARTTDALVLAEDLAPGEVVTAEHLRVVEVTPAPGVRLVPGSARQELVGRSAPGPLAAGQLLAPDLLQSRGAAIGAGRALVAMALGPGALADSAQPGDRVRVLRVVTGPLVTGGPSAPPAEVLGEAVLWSRAATAAGQTVVTVAIAEELELAVSGAAAAGQVKLSVLGGR